MSKIIKVTTLATVAVIMVAVLAVAINDQTKTDDDNNDLYVFVLSGQSNAQYYKEDVSVANELPDVPYGAAFYYGTDSAAVVYSDDYSSILSDYAIHPINNENGDYLIGSIEPGFASAFFEKTNKKCLIINTARGGASIADYMQGHYLYEYNSAILQDALSKVPAEYNLIKTSMIWIQGEADRVMSPSDYAAHFRELCAIFSALGYDSTLISKVRSQWAPSISAIQLNLAKMIKNVTITDIADSFSVSSGTMDADGLHYSQLGRNILGSAIGQIAPVDNKDVTAGYELLQLLPILCIISILVAIIAVVIKSKQQ